MCYSAGSLPKEFFSTLSLKQYSSHWSLCCCTFTAATLQASSALLTFTAFPLLQPRLQMYQIGSLLTPLYTSKPSLWAVGAPCTLISYLKPSPWLQWSCCPCPASLPSQLWHAVWKLTGTLREGGGENETHTNKHMQIRGEGPHEILLKCPPQALPMEPDSLFWYCSQRLVPVSGQHWHKSA